MNDVYFFRGEIVVTSVLLLTIIYLTLAARRNDLVFSDKWRKALSELGVGKPNVLSGLQKRYVFVDRDGVINFNLDNHVKDCSEFRFLPGAISALVTLAQAGFE